VQSVGQVIPGGTLVTVPEPVPARLTVRAKGLRAKVAVTFWALVTMSVHVLVLPLQSPPQLTKLEPLVAVAVSVTLVPWSKLSLQSVGQLIPGGELVTVPVPLPANVTVTA
jgi:hypothetical protein